MKKAEKPGCLVPDGIRSTKSVGGATGDRAGGCLGLRASFAASEAMDGEAQQTRFDRRPEGFA